ncbi:alpha-L-fucosidase [Enterococcus sp. LJL98]
MTQLREDIIPIDMTEVERPISRGLEKKLEWFQNQKLGVIFHWGLYTETAMGESWQLVKNADWTRKNGMWRDDLDVLRVDYWDRMKEFNPIKFDPTQWANICKKNGVKYIVFTTKHHDGFSLYDTRVSDFKITSPQCPYSSQPQADVYRSVLEAFRAVDIGIGAYFSKPDWHSPYYWIPGKDADSSIANYDPLEKPSIWKKFNDFTHAQIKEICTEYGDLDILWLDGGWVNASNNEMLDMDAIIADVRRKTPDLIVADRTIGGIYENYRTPEQQVPSKIIHDPWESCITLADNWCYLKDDVYKPFEEVLEMFLEIVSKGGNLLLGIGPKFDGTLPEKSVQLLNRLGDWLEIFGEGIYDTRPFDFGEHSGVYATKKEKELFLFYRHELSGNQISLNNIENKLLRVIDLQNKKAIDFTKNTITLPETEAYIGCCKLRIE